MHHHTIILFKIKTRFIFIGSVMLLDFLSLCARCCEYQYQKKVKWQYNQQMIFVVSGTAVRLYWTLWKSFILICTLAQMNLQTLTRHMIPCASRVAPALPSYGLVCFSHSQSQNASRLFFGDRTCRFRTIFFPANYKTVKVASTTNEFKHFQS